MPCLAMLNYVITFSELVKNAALYYKHALDTEKQEIVMNVFSELNLSGKTLDFKAKNGFQSLESRLNNRFVAPCARGGS